jgi:UDP-N-acetylglucosamine--N-acetylmuramyl-(pentapeptide) pyrophosphoryl-undecaprenol N-acetylglucosamine transferase
MKQLKIMIVGGGSGGHLTPVVAIADSLKQLHPSTVVVHVGQKGEGLVDVVHNPSIDESYAITAGKFRRYHGESFISHLLDVKTLILNARDFFRFMYGTIEAYRLLGKARPACILLKGGFVSVPVGFAARVRKIPYLTHDSDAVPGLANKITAKHAIYNTTALPAALYPYDQAKTKQVGIPIRKEFKEVLPENLNLLKEKIGIGRNKTVIFSVGGGLGAQKINQALVRASKTLLESENNCYIVHLTGKKHFDETKKQYQLKLSPAQMNRIQLIDFTTDLYKYSAAADIVLTRAGATNIAEFAAQAKTCVVVPAPHLTGGQQLHNAEVLRKTNAAIIVDEESLSHLDTILLDAIALTQEQKNAYGKALHKLAVYDSADKLANILIDISMDK